MLNSLREFYVVFVFYRIPHLVKDRTASKTPSKSTQSAFRRFSINSLDSQSANVKHKMYNTLHTQCLQVHIEYSTTCKCMEHIHGCDTCNFSPWLINSPNIFRLQTILCFINLYAQAVANGTLNSRIESHRAHCADGIFSPFKPIRSVGRSGASIDIVSFANVGIIYHFYVISNENGDTIAVI